MNDDRHVDRYVRITNRERFLIVRALGVLTNCYNTLAFAYDWQDAMQTRDLFELRNVFCEENWRIDSDINTDKVVSVQTMEQDDE